MSESVAPIVVINAVGLTSRWLSLAPCLKKLATSQGLTRMGEVWPAVTCTAQATLITGKLPSEHGVVGNGWFFRDTAEVRFWQQSNRLIEAEPVYETFKKRALIQGRKVRTSKIFWWFNQGAKVDFSLTPKPWYGSDGDKRFGITGSPNPFPGEVEKSVGSFPFPSFWGPRAGLPSTEWIARAAAWHLERDRPDLMFVYLPHLDYDPQRFGPSGSDMPRLMGELDRTIGILIEACEKVGARPWVVSEYGHLDTPHHCLPNMELRKRGMLEVRDGPFGETLDTYQSRAFAVVDHQLAHVYVRDAEDIPKTRELLVNLPGVAQALVGSDRKALGLDHPRSGEIVLVAKNDSWFAYPYWLDNKRAPDFARTIDIHRKPGYDPCELFVDPQLRFPMLRILRRLLAKKMGFRTLFDIIPLNPSLVRGSHGIACPDPLDRPVWIGSKGLTDRPEIPMTAFRDYLLEGLGCADE